MTRDDRLKLLAEYGWIVGKRDPRLNTDYAGEFMVCEPFEECEVPTRDGSNGPWCVVGDDLEKLIVDASDVLESMLSVNPTKAMP